MLSMTVLFGQISAAKVKSFSSTLYERALDSEGSAVFLVEVVGTIKGFDDDAVRVKFFFWGGESCFEMGDVADDSVEGTFNL